jgi:hypothetical protein
MFVGAREEKLSFVGEDMLIINEPQEAGIAKCVKVSFSRYGIFQQHMGSISTIFVRFQEAVNPAIYDA